MNLPLEGRISGPNTGFEVTVPGRQGIRAMRHSIPLAGAPTSIATSLRGLLFFCSALFLPVVSRQRRAPCSIVNELFADYRMEGLTMPYSIEDFRRDVARKHVHELTPEERLAGLPPEQIEAYLQRLAKKPATTRKKNPKRKNRTT